MPNSEIERAIAFLENKDQIGRSAFDIAEWTNHNRHVLLTSLQAQIKPGCETCQWCSRGQLFVQRNYATVLRTGWMLPTYCPNCGKVLKGGE